ncbi:MAG: metallophosphoesterase [Armatimonadota bacterium]|nr:metallophosphoesterase [bacterium]MDW8320480.1 metallophosphoesterase [Armatimonadota bacterium]
MSGFARRELLKGLGVAALGAAAWLHLRPVSNAQTAKRVLRVAHLTDIHVQPEGKAVQGMINCLKAVHETPDRPNLILFGGDNVMDVFAQKRERAKTLADLWRKMVMDYCQIPYRICIGNHDVWGWNKETSGCTGQEPEYGKKWAMDTFGLQTPYYSFEQAGWKFVVLDSTYPHGNDYKGRLDDEQFEWLKEQLRRTPATTPVLILSHIPILSASAFLDGENEKSGDWVVPGAWMHIDARRIIELFYQHKNVKLCLSGHIHLLDRVEYNGVGYICDGAVSGAWWGGNYHQTPPGWGLIDLYADGTFTHEYRSF